MLSLVRQRANATFGVAKRRKERRMAIARARPAVERLELSLVRPVFKDAEGGVVFEADG
jgi:hypothetical protein